MEDNPEHTAKGAILISEIRLLHTADIHLDRQFRNFPGVKGTKRRLEIRDRFIRVMELAREEKVHAVLIAGDLFDTDRPSLGTIDLVKEWFKILEKDGIRVLITPGTHDSYNEESVWAREKFSDNVHIFKSIELTYKNLPEINLSVLGAANEVSNSSRRILRDIRIDRGNTHDNRVIMVHGSVPVPWARSDNYFPISIEELNASEVQYVALGHYHSYYPFQVRGKAAYSGSPVLLDFEERKDKYALLVRIRESAVDIDPIKISQKYSMHEIDVDCTRVVTEEDLIKQLEPENDRNRILKVNLKGAPAINADIDGIVNRVAKLFDEEKSFFHVIWNDETKIAVKLVTDEKTVRGIFIKKMSEKMESLKEEEKRIYELALHLGVKAIDEGKL